MLRPDWEDELTVTVRSQERLVSFSRPTNQRERISKTLFFCRPTVCLNGPFIKQSYFSVPRFLVIFYYTWYFLVSECCLWVSLSKLSEWGENVM